MMGPLSIRRRLALWLCPDPALNSAAGHAPLPPVYPGKAVPAWWTNAALREFLTQSHGRMQMVDAHAEAVRRFGATAPSRSALHRYWQLLEGLNDLSDTTPAETHFIQEPR